ncbi:cupin domain-containing protein [Deinococcus cellulosilyticus]|uniref:Cupin type-2 domain-containing protein n=1 Tax=Deinococcus cellulosilyticus (strain DSM 18568 / NBRC 106333 / KACC 11606 / 5516J-15) TaxID=1223518 RepID=A0A511MZW5_DEIC1|nr:cupin domain-containing protein [Deinococcus cellulosilyticus]GEM46102.1 hypothetical protein DC3_17370 [Deinococcus cellulosilyticus NBRC 106333 = KACC 11606]
MNHLNARIIRADQGKTINGALEDVQLKLTGIDTDGSYTLGLVTTQVGGSIPPHLHHREDELLILLYGELECLTSEGWQTAHPGDVVFFPSGVMHAYRNTGTVAAKHWVIANPAGVEAFYQQLAPLLNPSPSLNHISTLSRNYGIEFMGVLEDK